MYNEDNSTCSMSISNIYHQMHSTHPTSKSNAVTNKCTVPLPVIQLMGIITRTVPSLLLFFFSMARQPLGGPGLLIVRRFAITHFRHTTIGRTLLDDWPARRRYLYVTTYNTHKRQTSMPLAGFEPTIPASERPQTHASDRAVTGIGILLL
jgi:hypothetical protein